MPSSITLGSVEAFCIVALQNSELIDSRRCAWLSSSVAMLVIVTVRPPRFATAPQFGKDCPIVAPSGPLLSPAFNTMSMKSGSLNFTWRARYGLPARAAASFSSSCLIGSSRACHASESRLMRANVIANPAFHAHGS